MKVMLPAMFNYKHKNVYRYDCTQSRADNICWWAGQQHSVSDLDCGCMAQAHRDRSVVATYTLGTRVEWPEPEAQHSLSLPTLKLIYIQLVRPREHPRLHYGDQPVTACSGGTIAVTCNIQIHCVGRMQGF
jgi:hypothetical protein